MRPLPAAVCALLAAAAVVAAVPSRVRVTADRVQLRARPDATVESVGLATAGQELEAPDGPGGEWVRVVPPPEVSVWIYSELVRDGVVTVDKAKVRAGPGLAYKDVGTLARGERVDVRGRLGEWTKIRPPPSSSAWINRQFVEAVGPPAVTAAVARVSGPAAGPPAEPAAPPEPAGPAAAGLPGTGSVAAAPSAAPAAAVPEALVGRPLAAGRLQGGELRFTGDLVRAGFLVLHRPGRYRVISRDTHGRAVTLCYLVGRDEQLGPLDGATVRVEGPAWWVAGLPHPAVQVRRLVRVE